MHKRYLWVDRRGADLYWPALGNVDISATGKGTLVYWTRLQYPQGSWSDHKVWQVYCDDNNWMSSRYGRSITVKSGGTTYEYPHWEIDNESPSDWELHVIQWDFANGWMHSYYNDAQPVAEEFTGVPAPEGVAQFLQIGYPFSDPVTYATDNLLVHSVAVWDELLTTDQMIALYEQGCRYEIQESDGPGNLTFLLRLNEGMDADLAAGEGTFTRGDTTPLDRYCLLEEGARDLGRAIFPLGMPRQDGSEDDRKPLNAICPITLAFDTQQAAVIDTNDTNYSTLKVDGYTSSRQAGAYYPPIPEPGTYRQQIHVPNEGNVAGYEMGLGPVAYKHYPSASSGVFDQFGSGRRFTVEDDAGNTTNSFKTDLESQFGDDYWAGAYLHLFNGNCRGRCLKVAAYDSTTKFITLEADLPEIPEVGSVGFVNPYPRIIGQQSSDGALLYDYTMEANLWSHHGESKHFMQLEWQASYNAGFLRYGKGRTAVIPGGTCNVGGHGLNYGKWYGYTDPEPTELEIWLRKIEIAGPQPYQILRKRATGEGPALADSFMVLVRDSQGEAHDSVKVWRQQNLSLEQAFPTKNPDIQQATTDLEAPGTWRHTRSGAPLLIAYDEDTETVTCALIGVDQSGTARLGYVQGHWDEETGRIAWTDETPPPGKNNPMLDLTSLHTDRESDAPQDGDLSLVNILQTLDGTWSLLYCGRPDAVDHFETYALHGAPDRWSFDFAEQFDGPIVPMFKGVDAREPVSGNGFVPWGNMHLPWHVTENPYTQQVERRYLGYAGGKTIYNYGTQYSSDMRPVVGCAGADVKSLAPLPYHNAITALPGPNLHNWVATVLYQEDCISVLYADGVTSGVGLITAEDGVHFQMLYVNWGSGGTPLLSPNELPGESFHLNPAIPFRLGDRRIYYYLTDVDVNFAWIRYNGEMSYQLDEGETAGWLETAILERPSGGWGELYLNLDPAEGQLVVEVLDPQDEQPLAGYGQEDCETLGDSLRSRVTWNGGSLAELTQEHLRLRFYLDRSAPEQESPKLYAWETAPLEVTSPQVGDLRVEGETAPAGVGDATPTFSWTYSHSEGSQQGAFQVQIASSQELLAAGTPDMWDSGVILGSDTNIEYAGQPLADLETYFWRVRVRTVEGVWSEQW